MAFTNKKEDVIYMELTPYGRHLLSLGKLTPEYYAFFDDDILYDIGLLATTDTSNYPSGFLSESNGASKERILNETPYLNSVYSFANREDKIVSRQNFFLYEDLSQVPSIEKINYMNYPLGVSNYHSGQDTPYWDVVYLHGTSSTATKSTPLNVSSSGLPIKNIPQVDFTVGYEISIKNVYTDDEDLDQLDLSSPNLALTEVTTNGNYISLKEGQLMLHITEENAFSYSDSFSIEVFEYDELDSNLLVPLKFQTDVASLDNDGKRQEIVNDILTTNLRRINDDEADAAELEDSSLVEYYFDLRLDSEVPEEDVCNGVIQLQTKDIFVDLEVNCIERAGRDANVYTTRVDDIEEC
ncbi:MAG: hypothetical protein CBE07_003120 [Pelagibacteraceae bacterium TMED247]|nr:MAG: hypothetical protein CBE07_003120 [Pelagibacteraceae bacterium TMED247]|tara:strand:- start:6735 stop:7796 length:1062 start_codon:yes stop_codon:yes gene_type:complete